MRQRKFTWIVPTPNLWCQDQALRTSCLVSSIRLVTSNTAVSLISFTLRHFVGLPYKRNNRLGYDIKMAASEMLCVLFDDAHSRAFSWYRSIVKLDLMDRILNTQAKKVNRQVVSVLCAYQYRLEQQQLQFERSDSYVYVNISCGSFGHPSIHPFFDRASRPHSSSMLMLSVAHDCSFTFLAIFHFLMEPA